MKRRARLFAVLALVAGCSAAAAVSPSDGGDAGPIGGADAGASDGAIADALADTSLPKPDVVVPDTDCGAPASGPSVDLSGPAIFFTECNVVRASALDGTGTVTLVTGKFPTGVAIDPVALKLYWADNGTDAISRANLDGGSPETLYTSADPFSNPNAVAVDHAANKIFWTEGSVIKTAALDGTGPTVLYTGMFPTGLAPAPATSELFFTDNGTDGVHRGTYSGAAAILLYTAPNKTDNPAAVAVDEQQAQVFWAQAGGVYRMAPDGGGPTKIADAGFGGGIGLNPSTQQLYFSDNATDTITRVGYDGTAPLVVHQNTNAFSNPRGVVVRR